MERKCGTIKVTIMRGATIKVSISRTDRCTQRMNKTREKSYLEDLKIRTLAKR
jgi:hypothetical protein